MNTLAWLILVGGILHFGILIASAAVPQVLDWRQSLGKLDQLSRQLIWVHGAFIVLVIIGFGLLSLICAADLASGTTLARAVCSFIAVFWTCRLAVQFFVFDAGPFLKNWLLKIGYHGLTAVFLYQAVVFGYAAVWP
ncbi:MAG: hypothetical protein HY000_10490 [Planctomycetes bacterium]|nr:hypothetical protein [Planctomycetota bacterium]